MAVSLSVWGAETIWWWLSAYLRYAKAFFQCLTAVAREGVRLLVCLCIQGDSVSRLCPGSVCPPCSFSSRPLFQSIERCWFRALVNINFLPSPQTLVHCRQRASWPEGAQFCIRPSSDTEINVKERKERKKRQRKTSTVPLFKGCLIRLNLGSLLGHSNLHVIPFNKEPDLTKLSSTAFNLVVWGLISFCPPRLSYPPPTTPSPSLWPPLRGFHLGRGHDLQTCRRGGTLLSRVGRQGGGGWR